MIITLYKNCILSDSYSEVFNVHTVDVNNKTCHDRYLDTLEHYVVNAPNVYVPQSGRISVELNLDGDAYQFNYMKLENEDNGFKRFCFIDSINVVNSIAIINYTEDVWSNYAPDMKIRKSLLTRSRIIDYGSYQIPFYSPGMEYQGNNPLKLVSIFKDNIQRNTKCALVFQIQLYKLSEQGTINERLVLEGVWATSTSNGYEYYEEVNLIYDTLLGIIQNSSQKTVSFGDQTYNYEIYNTILVPDFFDISFDGLSGSFLDITYSENGRFRILVPGIITIQKEITYTNTKVLTTNFKQFKIGTMSKAYDIVQNGTPIEVKIGYYALPDAFALFLNFQNQIYEITRDFEIKLPISVQTADVTQQQATAREMADMNAKMGIASGAMKIASGLSDATFGVLKTGVGIATGNPSTALSGAQQVANVPSSIGQGIMSTIGSAKQLEVANRAQYVTNKGADVTNRAMLNAVYGILIFEIEPDNEIEVQANIDNTGYVVNEIVDNLFDTQTTGVANKYNVMQFDYVNLYGKFSQRVADVLREILNNGFKIWYDETAVNE